MILVEGENAQNRGELAVERVGLLVWGAGDGLPIATIRAIDDQLIAWGLLQPARTGWAKGGGSNPLF